MLAGTRCLFQPIPNESNENMVYLITESSIKAINSWSTEQIIVFFDADGPSCRPAQFIIDNRFIKIIGTSSPAIEEQKWTTKLAPGAILSRIVTTLWSRQELFLTGWVIVSKSGNCIDMLYRMFLAVSDFPYSRLRESTMYFGFNPRTCFDASSDPRYLVYCLGVIEKKIKETAEKTSLHNLWNQTCSTKSISHAVFQISPTDLNDDRLITQVITAAISPWALTTILKIYEDFQAGASFEFYQTIKGLPNTGTIRGQMFQVHVLKHLSALKGGEQFTIRRLTDSVTFQWTYPVTSSSFSHSSTFPQLLQDAVNLEKSVHLVPQEPNFPAVDSILYTHRDVLTGIQVTVTDEHPVAVVGLQRIQRWFKRGSGLTNFRPLASGQHWRLIFVVPEEKATNFKIQKFEGNGSKGWLKKVDQCVLGIKEDTLWRRTSQLLSSS